MICSRRDRLPQKFSLLKNAKCKVRAEEPERTRINIEKRLIIINVFLTYMGTIFNKTLPNNDVDLEKMLGKGE